MKKIIILFALLVFTGVVIFWTQYNKGTVHKKNSGPVQEVNLKLKWVHQAQFAGNYVAVEKGYYADERLKVNITPFSFEDPTIDAVVAGRADFGITGADELVLARARGLPIKAIAVIYKINPVTAYALKKSGIIKPQDFIGKTVGLEQGVNVEYLYSAMMSKLKIDRSKIKEVAIGYDAAELLSGKTDVSTGYIINEPNQAREAGAEVNTILMADYGVNMYADVLFATEETIQSKSDVVKRFLKATLQGWQYAIEHEDEAVGITLQYATNSSKQHEAYMLHTSVPLIHTGKSAIGWMEIDQWKQVENILLEQKILARPIIITDAYTMEFLHAIHSN